MKKPAPCRVADATLGGFKGLFFKTLLQQAAGFKGQPSAKTSTSLQKIPIPTSEIRMYYRKKSWF